MHRSEARTRRGVEERLFTLAFSGLVYPQIWEDPEVDLKALNLKDGERLIAIASGGCNLLAYASQANAEIIGIDLNPTHVAFNKLKHAALETLDYGDFADLFGRANLASNIALYEGRLAPRLDAETRRYWEGRDRLGRVRIGYFAKNIYAQGLLGRFISGGHAVARAHGRNPERMMEARSLEDQRAIFAEELAPLFEKGHLRWLMDKPASLFGLGIPPSQFDALKGREASMADVLKARLERLACGFDMKQNYFAWQAFGRRYGMDGEGPLPRYLEQPHFETLKARLPNVSITHASFTEKLAASDARSLDAYVLLDAQDWMTDAQLTSLWREISRTAAPGARVIFRTAGEETILPGRVPSEILARFTYDRDACSNLTLEDRSSIYGGFHCYVFQG